MSRKKKFLGQVGFKVYLNDKNDFGISVLTSSFVMSYYSTCITLTLYLSATSLDIFPGLGVTWLHFHPLSI